MRVLKVLKLETCGRMYIDMFFVFLISIGDGCDWSHWSTLDLLLFQLKGWSKSPWRPDVKLHKDYMNMRMRSIWLKRKLWLKLKKWKAWGQHGVCPTCSVAETDFFGDKPLAPANSCRPRNFPVVLLHPLQNCRPKMFSLLTVSCATWSGLPATCKVMKSMASLHLLLLQWR